MQIFKESLTPRHLADQTILAYIIKYVECRHNGQACKSVGITGVEGNNLRKHPDISNAIKKLTHMTIEKFGYSAEDMVERVREVADFDPGCVYNDDGTFKHMKDLSPEERRAIKGFDCRNIMEKDPNGMETGRMIGQVINYEFYDRIDSAKILVKEKGHFKDIKRVEHEVTTVISTQLIAGLKRAEEGRLLAARDVTGSGEDDV